MRLLQTRNAVGYIDTKKSIESRSLEGVYGIADILKPKIE